MQLKQSSLILMSPVPEGHTKGGAPVRRWAGWICLVGNSRASYLPPNTWMEKYGVEGLDVLKELYIQR